MDGFMHRCIDKRLHVCMKLALMSCGTTPHFQSHVAQYKTAAKCVCACVCSPPDPTPAPEAAFPPPTWPPSLLLTLCSAAQHTCRLRHNPVHVSLFVCPQYLIRDVLKRASIFNVFSVFSSGVSGADVTFTPVMSA